MSFTDLRFKCLLHRCGYEQRMRVGGPSYTGCECASAYPHEDMAMVGCFLDRYAIAAPARKKTTPVVERRVVQSESVMPYSLMGAP